MSSRHGGRILADQLHLNGVARVFSVPGESFLAALDGLLDVGIQNIVCRHEGGASMMAEAHAKLTNSPGIAFVTRGPGATNAASGIHVAKQDSTPMILFVGQIARSDRDREAFQEVDFRAMFAPLAKWTAEIDDPARIPEYVSRAFHVAMSGRPGPVVLSLPEDMLSASADTPDIPPPATRIETVSQAAVDTVEAALAQAQRPLVIAGGPLWTPQAATNLASFAKAWGLPVAVSFRRQDYIDNRNPSYVGDLSVGMNPKLGARLQEADLLLVLGARLGDIATGGYTLLNPASPGPRILHVHPDTAELGRVFRPDPGLAIPAPDLIAALAERNATPGPWSDWTASMRADYETWQHPQDTPGQVKMEQIVTWLAKNLPEDAILTNGAGNYAAFLHRYYRFRHFRTQLAPTSGSMGYGFPAAIAACLEHPDRTVICLAGDGCFQMTLNELSTARQYGTTPIVIVANNGRYGTIRMHQEKTYPGRISGTDLANPDFAALAHAYGGHGEVVEQDEDFAPAFDRAKKSRLPAIIELRLDPEALTPSMTLSETRKLAQTKT